MNGLRRFEILVPLLFNDGRPVPESLIGDLDHVASLGRDLKKMCEGRLRSRAFHSRRGDSILSEPVLGCERELHPTLAELRKRPLGLKPYSDHERTL